VARHDDEHLALILESEEAGLLAAADVAADTGFHGDCGDVAVRIFPAATSLSAGHADGLLWDPVKVPGCQPERSLPLRMPESHTQSSKETSRR
jgi:hypothetical protein